MTQLFQQVLRTLRTEPLTMHYIEGGRDREFGATYTGVFVPVNGDANSGCGLYYIHEQGTIYLRETTEEGVKTKRLGMAQEDRMPLLLTDVLREVYFSKRDLTFDRVNAPSVATANFFPPLPKPKPVVEKKIPEVEKELEWHLPNDEGRFLTLRGSAATATADIS